MFEQLLAANERYAQTFSLSQLPAAAARGFALVTCIDSRIEPLQTLGLVAGDAKIIRNAGARVTDDVLRSLALATSLLGVDHVAVMQHTGCAVLATEEELSGAVAAATGADTSQVAFLAAPDPDAALAADLDALLRCPLIPAGVTFTGWRYDVATGLIEVVIDPRRR